jgi:hypothetical protein
MFWRYKTMNFKGLYLILFFCTSTMLSQEVATPYRKIKILPSHEIIQLDSVSINRAFFKVINSEGVEIDSSAYQINYQKATLQFKKPNEYQDSLLVRFLSFPEFLTKTYRIYDEKRVMSNEAGRQLFQVKSNERGVLRPFEGLNTSGSITRGITAGNNQNAVLNSNLDLQITGKISDKVTLRASIQDSNIPLQEGGYSQRLDEFDQLFIELYADQWAIRAGDLFLENRFSRFINFNKKVQGVSAQFHWGDATKKTTVEASAALVRGQYARSNFVGQEGNQGPYKLRGNNGELYVLVISGSERVFVNGILLQRGENNQYMIDYNAGEIIFTSLYPITSEMRISIEYQYTDRNYTRFISYNGIKHEREKWHLGGYFYTESDIKNQPLQQSLTEDQVQILQQAGDDTNLMVASSAYLDTFSENKILYKKEFVQGIEIFVFSNNPSDELYNVRFSLLGNNQGNYVIANNQAVGRIYEYKPPINGVPQGSFEPVIRLVAPTKIQMATVIGGVRPNEKTSVDFELGMSHLDKNLFSNLDQNDNIGYAGMIKAKQRIWTGNKSQLDWTTDFQFAQANFNTIERLFTIEFNRDWNLNNPIGNQKWLQSGLVWNLKEHGTIKYQFENLDFSESFSGNKHVLDAFMKHKNWTFQNSGSLMESKGLIANSIFTRNQTRTKYHFQKNWVGASFAMEDVQERIVETQLLTNLSQRFLEMGTFMGRGDSTQVYVELGYLNRVNDSISNGLLQRVNQSHSYYLKSRLLQNEKQDLSIFINYRVLNFEEHNRNNEPSLNSRLLHNGRFFANFMQTATAFETSSGNIAQQEFTYLQVEPGQGVYTWIDYNGNGIQELEEFEVAPFPDQATYVRVFLPNQVFLPTHLNKFSQSLTINPMDWQNKQGFRKFLSRFYNQTTYLIERRISRSGGNFDLNPFASNDVNLLGLNVSFRNSLFYNRGKQKHSVTYTFLDNQAQNLLSIGSQNVASYSHQMQYNHLVKKTWLFSLQSRTIANALNSISTLTEQNPENQAIRNYNIQGYQMAPKISYLLSKNTSFDLFFESQTKENFIGDREFLKQIRLGTSFTYVGLKQLTINGEISIYDNQFEGSAVSPAAFQMLEGLQPGKNQTWRVLVQKNLTQFLDINLNYQGRTSETSQAIHTGTVQLRAFF